MNLKKKRLNTFGIDVQARYYARIYDIQQLQQFLEDMTDEVLYAMQAHDNICKYIHLPVLS